jgi:peptidoglycan/xylan/chitin deacetylase (PgdA/CDA1 family)
MKRRSTMKEKIIKGATLLFLLAFLILPSLTFLNWAKSFGLIDSRKAKPIAMQVRAVDKTGKPKLFEQPLLSVTFDDGWGSVFTHVYPLLQKHGVETTQYVMSGVFSDQQYMSKKQVEVMQQTGHQIGCHSVSHADLVTLIAKDLHHEVADCKKTLSDLYGNTKDFATPYSSYDDSVVAEIRKYFRSHRNTDGDPTNGIGDPDVNTGNDFDIYDITSVTIHRDTTSKQIADLIKYAQAHNSWLVLTYHAVDEGSSEYGLDTKKMEEQLKVMAESKIRIATVGQVLDEYQNRIKR